MKITSSFQHENVHVYKFGSNPLGKPRMFSHIYHVDGLLIDTAHSRMRKEVMTSISKLSIDQIFITHHHEDHTGNLLEIQKQFECPAYASSKCAKIMRNPPSISFTQWLIWGKTDANTSLQAKNDILTTPNHKFKIIPTPGHAIDMVCLYEANKGWLFSADLWVSEYIKYFMRPESMKQQIQSIRKILELDFEVLFCSHNPQLKGGKEKLRKKLFFFEDFYSKVANLYHKGHSAHSIIKQMGLKENWSARILSTGALSTLNMIKSVIRDEKGEANNIL